MEKQKERERHEQKAYKEALDRLAVVGTGDRVFIGVLRGGPDKVFVTLGDALAIVLKEVPMMAPRQQEDVKDQLITSPQQQVEMEEVMVKRPQAAILHWCDLEPIRRLKVKPDFIYMVKDQSPSSVELFAQNYFGGLAELKMLQDMKKQQSQMVQLASSGDGKALEAALQDPNNPLSQLYKLPHGGRGA